MPMVKKRGTVPLQFYSIHHWPRNSSCLWTDDVYLYIYDSKLPKTTQQGAIQKFRNSFLKQFRNYSRYTDEHIS